jgi:hypothetical protein
MTGLSNNKTFYGYNLRPPTPEEQAKRYVEKAHQLIDFYTRWCVNEPRHAHEMLAIYNRLYNGEDPLQVKADFMERTAVDRRFYLDEDPKDIAKQLENGSPMETRDRGWFPKQRSEQHEFRVITRYHKALRIGYTIGLYGREMTPEVRQHLPDWTFIRKSVTDTLNNVKHIPDTIEGIQDKYMSRYHKLVSDGVKPWLPVPAGIPWQLYRPYPNYNTNHSKL